MKRVFIPLLILFSLTSIAQESVFPIDSLSKKVAYTEIVQTNGTGKRLYNAGKKYFVNEYQSAKDVIQLDDVDNLELTGKAFTDVYFDYMIGNAPATKLKMYFSLNLSFKENKYKYVLTDIRFESYPTVQYPTSTSNSIEEFISNHNIQNMNNKQKRVRDGMMSETKGKIQTVIANLNKLMVQYSNESKDW